MSFLLKVFGTLLGVSTVMLTASLVVMCIVRVIQYLGNLRGKTVGEMLGGINRGFRFDRADSFVANDEAQMNFVYDVLTYPALHESAKLAKLTLDPTRPDRQQQQRATLAQQVEYLSKADLLAIVRTMLEGPAPSADTKLDVDDRRMLPARWSSHLAPDNRTFGAFRQYVERWYDTLDAVGTEQYKLKARRLTASVACVVVVFLNLDGLQFATDIFETPASQELLAQQAPIMLKRAQDMGATDAAAPPPVGRDALLSGVPETLQQANGVLNEPSLQFGWQNSKITKGWCACQAKGEACGSCGSRILDTIRWLVGLLFSCLLLSLGAPFWVDMLRNLLNFQNSVKQAFLPDEEKRSLPGTRDSKLDISVALAPTAATTAAVTPPAQPAQHATLTPGG